MVPVITCVAIAGAVYADSTITKTNPMESLVNAIAQKFNLNVNDVQAVFDEQKTKMEAEKEQNFTDQINQAVTDGKLTQVQAELIIAKRAELEAQKPGMGAIKKDESWANKTRGEMQAEMKARQAEMKAQQDALKQWATDNNIPQEYIRFLGMGFGPGFRGHGGPGCPMGKNAPDDNTAEN